MVGSIASKAAQLAQQAKPTPAASSSSSEVFTGGYATYFLVRPRCAHRDRES